MPITLAASSYQEHDTHPVPMSKVYGVIESNHFVDRGAGNLYSAAGERGGATVAPPNAPPLLQILETLSEIRTVGNESEHAVVPIPPAPFP